MHLKMVIGYTEFGNGLLQSPFLKQLTLSDRKMIQILCSMPLYDIRGPIIRILRYTKTSNIREHVIRGTQYTTIH